MPNELSLRDRAREAIRSGKLPTRKPDRLFGGAGSGDACVVCGELIERDQMQLEIEFNRHGATPGLDRFQVHPRCFGAWEFERTEIEGTSI